MNDENGFVFLAGIHKLLGGLAEGLGEVNWLLPSLEALEDLGRLWEGVVRCEDFLNFGMSSETTRESLEIKCFATPSGAPAWLTPTFNLLSMVTEVRLYLHFSALSAMRLGCEPPAGVRGLCLTPTNPHVVRV